MPAPPAFRPPFNQQAFPLHGGGDSKQHQDVGSFDQNENSGLFNRKAFTWNVGQEPRTAKKGDDKPAGARTAKKGDNAAPPPPDRIYEVVAQTASVRAEPCVDAKLKMKKSRGARFLVSEVSMNGWLRLASEGGWLMSQEQKDDEIIEIARFVDDKDTMLAVTRHQPQGICCLEVVFASGVPVRSAPDRRSQTVTTRRRGEYVFAHMQNFDGWMRLTGDEGWMMAWTHEWGELLRPRRGVGNIDLWALNDMWACARKRPGVFATGLSMKDVQALKDLEKRMADDAAELFEKSDRGCKPHELLERELISAEDLKCGEPWTLRRLFAGLLVETVRDGDTWLHDLLPNFKHKWPPPVPPVPRDEEVEGQADEEEEWNTWGNPLQGLGVETLGPNFDPLDPQALGGTTPLEYQGHTYMMAPNGVVFDPPHQVPMGIWNEEKQLIEPAVSSVPGLAAATISYFGRTYLLLPDHKLVDPETEAIVGTYNPETGAVQLAEATEASGDIPLYDPAFDDGEPTHPSEYLERGHQSFKRGRYKAAACLYSEALKGCAQQRSVDLDFECEILRARCSCWVHLETYQELLEDADRILSSGSSLGNTSAESAKAAAEVKSWRRLAMEKLGRQPPSEAQPVARPLAADSGGAETCVQCNGLASKCAACGVGMERCANCTKPVSRANCCSGCMCTYYCDRDCQRTHWKMHKKECKKLAAD